MRQAKAKSIHPERWRPSATRPLERPVIADWAGYCAHGRPAPAWPVRQTAPSFIIH